MKMILFIYYSIVGNNPHETIILDNGRIEMQMSYASIKLKSDSLPIRNVVHFLDGILKYDCQYVKVSILQKGVIYYVDEVNYSREASFFTKNKCKKTRYPIGSL